jgi:hypothetical protein
VGHLQAPRRAGRSAGAVREPGAETARLQPCTVLSELRFEAVCLSARRYAVTQYLRRSVNCLRRFPQLAHPGRLIMSTPTLTVQLLAIGGSRSQCS